MPHVSEANVTGAVVMLAFGALSYVTEAMHNTRLLTAQWLKHRPQHEVVIFVGGGASLVI